MLAIVLAVYGLIAVALAAGAVTAAPPSRRGNEMVDGYDRATLTIVAVIASAAWPLLLSVYVVGWVGSPEARAMYRAAGLRWATVRGWTRRLYRLRRTAH